VKNVTRDDNNNGDNGGEDVYNGLGWLGDAYKDRVEQETLAEGFGDLK
jgi:hypothetical protein